jgi:hypothetical protein
MIVYFRSCGLGKIDQNVISLGLDHIGSHGKCARDNLTCRHVELVAMPRTSDYRSVDPSLSQWPAAMRADIVQGVEGTVDVEESNRFPSNADNFARAGRYLVDFCDLHHHHQRSPVPRWSRPRLDSTRETVCVDMESVIIVLERSLPSAVRDSSAQSPKARTPSRPWRRRGSMVLCPWRYPRGVPLPTCRGAEAGFLGGVIYKGVVRP